MKITEEMVRELQKRVDVSYEEAEYTLKRTNGDVNLAVYIIMKRKNSGWRKFIASVGMIFEQLVRYKLILTRKGAVIVNVPLLLVIVLITLDGFYRHLLPLLVILIVALIFECEVKIEKTQEKSHDKQERPEQTNNTVQTEQSSVQDVKQKSSDATAVNFQSPTVVETKVDENNKNPNDEDYFEIVVEE